MPNDNDKKTILLIDDDPVILQSLNIILKDHYRIRALKSGKTAVKACKTEPVPDLVLLDIVMPEIDGFHVIKELKTDSECRNIPVIFISSKSEKADEFTGLALGAVDYITKPIQPPIVLARVKSQIALKQARDHLEQQVRQRTEKLSQANEELKNTLFQLVRSFSLIIEQRDPSLAGHSRRVAEKSRKLALKLKLSAELVDDIFLSGLLARIGSVTLQDKILETSEHNLSVEDRKAMIERIINARLLFLNIDSLVNVGKIIEHQYEHFGGSGLARGLIGETIPIGSRILAIVRDYDLMIEGKLGHTAYSHTQAIKHLRRFSGSYYDPDIVDAFIHSFGHEVSQKAEHLESIGLTDLVPGMEIIEVRMGNRVYVRNRKASQELIEELNDMQHELKKYFQILIQPHYLKEI